MCRKDVLGLSPLFQPIQQVRGNISHISLDGVPGVLTGNDQFSEVLVEDIPDHLDGQIRLAVEHFRCERLVRGRPFVDARPLGTQPVDVMGQLFFAGPLSGGANNDTRIFGQVVLQNALEAVAFNVGEFA